MIDIHRIEKMDGDLTNIEMLIATFSVRTDLPNSPESHQAKVDAAREAMGTKYLCHPDNRVQAKVNYPVKHNQK